MLVTRIGGLRFYDEGVIGTPAVLVRHGHIECLRIGLEMKAQAGRELMHHLLRHETEFIDHFAPYVEIPLEVAQQWLTGREHPRG